MKHLCDMQVVATHMLTQNLTGRVSSDRNAVYQYCGNVKGDSLWIGRVSQAQHSTVQTTEGSSRQRFPEEKPPEVL